MNVKTWMPLGLALGLGLVAAFVAHRTMRDKSAGQARKAVVIAVAKTALSPGASLGPDDITLSPMPGETAPPQTFTDAGELIGRVVSAPVVPGQAFVSSLLAPKGTLAGLEALVPAGMRAVTVDVSESAAIAGLLSPGSHVDVVATSINRDRPEKTLARTIVQNLTVAAVGQHLGDVKREGDKDVPVARTVTLLASPHDAQLLDMALSVGRLRLVMRATGDHGRDIVDNTMFTELLSGDDWSTPAPVVPVVAAATQPAIEQVFAPTTRPAPAAMPGQPFVRIVTVINGAEERHLSFEEPLPVRATDYTDISPDRDPAIKN